MGERRKRQDKTRKAAVAWVVEQLAPHMESDLKWVRSTNRLFPCGNLKREKLKAMFGDWPSECYGQGRIFTLKLAGEVTRQLRRRLGMDISEFQSTEDQRLLSLLKSSRKHYVMASVDVADTLPIEDRWFFFYKK